MLIQGNAMVFSTTTKKLGWEWSDGRKITGKAIVKIEEIKKSNGLFYSPSLVDHIPDGITLKGEVLFSTIEVGAQKVKLKFPEPELNEQELSTYFFLGFLDTDTCICIKTVPDEVTKSGDLESWYKNQDC